MPIFSSHAIGPSCSVLPAPYRLTENWKSLLEAARRSSEAWEGHAWHTHMSGTQGFVATTTPLPLAILVIQEIASIPL